MLLLTILAAAVANMLAWGFALGRRTGLTLAVNVAAGVAAMTVFEGMRGVPDAVPVAVMVFGPLLAMIADTVLLPRPPRDGIDGHR